VTIAAEEAYTRVPSREVVDTILQTPPEPVQGDEKVTLAGFGAFKLLERAARIGRGSRNGSPVKIAARTRMRFEQAAAMRALVHVRKRGRRKAHRHCP